MSPALRAAVVAATLLLGAASARAAWSAVPAAAARARLSPVPSPRTSGTPRLAAVSGWLELAGRGHDRAGRSMVRLVDGAARSLRAGSSLPAALADGAADAGPPAGDAVRRVLRRVDTGDGMVQALAAWRAQDPSPAVAAVVAAVSLTAEVGGGVADALEGVGRSVRMRRELAAHARVMSSQARASAALLVALPVAVAALGSAADPDLARVLWTTPPGWVCLALAAALDLVGWRWMRRIVRSVS